MSDSTTSETAESVPREGWSRRLRQFFDDRVPAHERGSLSWATAWFFCILFGYYQLRPLREAKGFARGSDEIPWLFLGSFLAMLVAVPIYGWVAKRGQGLRLVRSVYRFFAINMLVFFCAMQLPDENVAIWVGRVYFVWLSVFNLFVVSLMWSVFADVYQSEQGKRLFGFISAGGTIGGILGSQFATWLSSQVDVSYVMLSGIVFLEVSLLCAARFTAVSALARTKRALPERAFESTSKVRDSNETQDEQPTGSVWDGVRVVFTTPYLLGIFFFLLAIKMCATTVYCEQGDLIRNAGLDEPERFRLLSNINTGVLVLTLVVQLLGTAAILRRLGVAVVLCIFPAIYVVGFTTLAIVPKLAVVVGLVVLHRAAAYAVIAPAVQILYTVVERDKLYRAKGFLDTVVVRGGDVLSAQLFGGLRLAGASLTGIAIGFVPVAMVTCLLGWWVGQQQQRKGLLLVGAEGEKKEGEMQIAK